MIKELEKNQTIQKGQLHCHISVAGSRKGYGGYSRATITKAKVDHFFTWPSHWNKEIFEEIDCIPACYDGQRERSEFRIRLDDIKKHYPNIKIC